jgi:peptidoglycan hydrolase CwlO-like protein
MADTRSQDLEARFNTMQSGFLETQKEVKQLSATIASIDSSIQTTINTMKSSMEEVKQGPPNLNPSLHHFAPN